MKSILSTTLAMATAATAIFPALPIPPSYPADLLPPGYSCDPSNPFSMCVEGGEAAPAPAAFPSSSSSSSSAIPTPSIRANSTLVPPMNSTLPSTTTEIVAILTTWCPEPTTLVINGNTYPVESATTLTITDCPCTVTRPVNGGGVGAAPTTQIPIWTPAPSWTTASNGSGNAYGTGMTPVVSTATGGASGGGAAMPSAPIDNSGGRLVFGLGGFGIGAVVAAELGLLLLG